MRLFLRRLVVFVGRVLRDFWDHRGLMMAAALAYTTLISLVPLIAVVLAALSLVFEPEQITAILGSELALILPGQADALVRELERFVADRTLIGGLGVIILLVFASLAFRTLEEAMGVIFGRRRVTGRRRVWISALLPYVYIVILVVALFALTAVVSVLSASAGGVLFGAALPDLSGAALAASGFFGLALLFTLIYRLMPTVKVDLRRAFVGGMTAAILWEIVRRFLTWYFTNISLVSLIYGSLTAVVIVLFSFEIAALIVLFGAQIIAELQHSADAGLPWYEAAPDERTQAPAPPSPSALARSRP
ncbi:MAG: YihY/virulence factor BrkB family protein [Nannocystaceae bacterium]